MAVSKTKSLCSVGGRFRRTIGKFVNAQGRLSPKKFLLGTDRGHAERANLRLEQLWRDIEIHWKKEPLNRACDSDPIWEPLTLQFAEAIRAGRRITLSETEIEQREKMSNTGSGVVSWYWWIRSTYSSIADLMDEPTHQAFQRSRKSAADHATVLASLSIHYADLANEPTAAAPPGHTLYAALDTWTEEIRKAKTRNDGHLIEGGRKIIEAARRFKDSQEDLPLHRLDYNAVKLMADYWCSRPPSKAAGKNFGKPISVITVQNMIGYLRQFLDWLHRSHDFQWRDTDRIIEGATGNRRTTALLTPEEVKKAARGPDAWTIVELVELYRHATERERLYLLLGLNGGFAQSEIMHLLKDEVHLDTSPPRVGYIRHKTGKKGVFTLWPETAQGLRWLFEQQRRFDGPSATWAILGTTGKKLDRQRITNTWANLIRRVRMQVPTIRTLPFKMLRKTNGHLINSVKENGSEAVALIQARAKRTEFDDQADAYFGRYESEVRDHLMLLHQKLKPMFDSVREIFVEHPKYARPTRRMSSDKLLLLHELRGQGMGVVEIAKRVGCSPSSVSKYSKLAERDGSERARR